MSKKTLILPVKREYFDQIKSGEKPEEYRLDNAYWRSRLFKDAIPREFDQVIITLGYPPAGDASRRLVFPWRGFDVKSIRHKHFGGNPAQVFAIQLQP